MPRRAKIVCTLGPATSTAGQVTTLVEAGMDIARLNFSHGSHADHARSYRLVREAAQSTGRAVGVLADLQGPKIRLGRFAPGLAVVWQPGDQVVITVENVIGTPARVSTTYAELPSDVVPGNRLLVDDGNLALEVLAVDGPDVRCQVLEGGRVSDNKGLSMPGVALSVPALSDKDIADLRFALSLRVDWVALSFVRSPDDAKQAREIMTEAGERLPLIAKLERPEAVDRLEEIVEAFDGIMVARGDLGVELPLERVPLVQKVAVQLARENSKPVIVATQMLESMIDSFRPTRAEASDVANAVLDGADAVMLSGETSVGRYPVEAVRTMGRMARFHSRLPLLAFTPEPAVRSQLALTWGVETHLAPYVAHTDEMVAQVQDCLLTLDGFEPGDLVVIVAGSPPGTPGSTNALRVWRLGDEVPGTGEGDVTR